MAIGRAARRAERAAAVEAAFGPELAPAALDLLELVEYAWHDCYQEITPHEGVVADILACAGGDLARMVRFAHLAVTDSRDLHVAADKIKGRS
ncbi:hypothetical protein ACWEO1_14145 [Kitasatospora cineracea]